MSQLSIPPLGAAGGPGGYSDQVNALLQSIGSPLPYLVKSIDGGTTSDSANLAAAVSALTAGGGDIVVVGRLRLVSDPVVPKNVRINWGLGGMFRPDAGVTVTVNSVFTAPERQIFDLSGAGSAVVAPLVTDWFARWFGAKGDGSTDDTAALVALLATVQGSGRNANARLGAGVFLHNTSLAYGAANNGFAFIGTPWSSRQQGSHLPVSVLRWTGGADSQIKPDGVIKVINIAFQNIGSATNAIDGQSAGEQAHILGCTWVVPSGIGASAWSNACVRLQDFNYSLLSDFDVESSPFLDFPTGQGTTFICDDGLIDCPSGAGPAVKFEGSGSANVIRFGRGVQFNAETAGNKFFDNTANSGSISQLDIQAQFDANDQTLVGPIIRAQNVKALNLKGVDIHAYPQLTDAFCVVTNSTVYLGRNSGSSIAQPLVRSTDTASRIVLAEPSPGMNPNNTKGMYTGTNSSAQTATLIPVTIGAETAAIAKVHLEQGDPGGECTYDVNVSTNANFTFTLATPTDSDGHTGSLIYGQKFEILIRNNSGGAMGTVTWSSHFVLKSAFSAPASGAWIALRFQCINTNAASPPLARELGRSA